MGIKKKQAHCEGVNAFWGIKIRIYKERERMGKARFTHAPHTNQLPPHG